MNDGGAEPDIVIIGAGVAGLTVARRAAAHGLTVTVLEAKARIGGRALTDTGTFGIPWDRGAAWLHDATRNPFRDLADRAGFAYDTRSPVFRLWEGGGWTDDETAADYWRYVAEAFGAIKAAGAAGADRPAAEVVPGHPRFGPPFESWCAALSGCEPDRLSTLDDVRYRDDSPHWLVGPGLGALVAHFGARVPVRLATPARTVRWDGAGVAVETDGGTLRAQAAVVTVSTSALAAGAVRFQPPLPAPVAQAFDDVPLGEAEKVAVAFDRDVFDLPANTHLHFLDAERTGIRFVIRPFGHPLAVGYMAGLFAREMAAAGPRAMEALAIERLAEVFGEGIHRHRVGAAATGWTVDADIRGGYSSALPGRAESRRLLGEPIAEHLFFAGEAASIEFYGTVNGAHAAGRAAADRIAARLGVNRARAPSPPPRRR